MQTLQGGNFNVGDVLKNACSSKKYGVIGRLLQTHDSVCLTENHINFSKRTKTTVTISPAIHLVLSLGTTIQKNQELSIKETDDDYDDDDDDDDDDDNEVDIDGDDDDVDD